MVEGSKPEDSNQSHFRDIVTETIFAFIFWSLFYAFGPMIWFYPLNELEISGYEVYVVVWLSPILLIIPRFLDFLQNKWVLNLLRLIMVACIGSFQAPDTLTRLQILALGNCIGMLQLAATIYSKTNIKRSITFWGLILGYFALLVGRIWFVSISPAFSDINANTVVITIGLIACVDRLLLSGFDGLPHDIPPVERKQTPSSLLTGIAFGSLLYVTQWLFGEVSVIARWSVTGYPSPGPAPNPWGILILLSLAVGAVLFSDAIVSMSKIWWLLGLIGFLVLYFYRGYLAFAGGVLLALYIMSLWPSMLDQVSCTCPPVTLTTAVFVYLIETFFWVWTVAYNFVPGGVYTREHTDYLIGFVMLSLLVGFHLMKQSARTYSFASYVNTSMPSKAIRLFLGLMILVGASGFVYRVQPKEYGHQLSEHKEFSAMIWTYHFGYDNRGWPSLERTAKLIEETGADVVGLLESDASKPFLGHNDLGMWLGERLKMYVDFGPATKDHTWGSLLLSKYPIVDSRHLLLPSPEGELAPAVVATVNMTGHLVDVIVVHMGNDRDDLDRKLQAEVLADTMADSKHPIVFLGYVTSAPNSRDYKHLTSAGKAKDIDSTDLDRWCEYIFYRKLIRLGYARISHASLSDTEVQMAKFRIPDSDDYVDNDKIVKKPDAISEHIRFNSRFGEYKDGHNYLPDHLFHMSTPKYFVED